MIDRRAFLSLVGISVALPSALQGAPTPVGVGGATPGNTNAPDPVNLGSGVTLIDYRVYPASSHNRIIGEIRNTTGRMIDAPVVSFYYAVDGEERAGFAYAAPMLPVVPAHDSVPIFGTVPEGVDPAEVLASADFSLCTPAEPGEYTEREQQLDLSLQIIEEEIDTNVYRAEGVVRNTGNTTATGTMVRGIVRDADGRVVGSTTSAFTNVIAVSEAKPFTLWGDISLRNKANPFVLLSGDDYTVDIIAGTRGPVVLPGCSFGTPWS